MLTDAQIQDWKKDGYCMAPDFFSAAETHALQSEVERLKREGRMNNVATAGDGETTDNAKQNLQAHNPGVHSPLIRAMPFADKVCRSVTALVGQPNELQTVQIFYKPAGNGSATNWHQDNAYFGALDNAMGTGMWIAIHDANEANGTMRVIPGSHLEEYAHERDPNSNHHIRCFPNEDQAIPCMLPAGGVLFFNYGVAHCTGPNLTDGDRAGLALHVHHDEIPCGPGQITARREKGGKRNYCLLAGGDGGLELYGQSQRGEFDRLVREVNP